MMLTFKSVRSVAALISTLGLQVSTKGSIHPLTKFNSFCTKLDNFPYLTNVLFSRFDAYEMEEVLDYFEIEPNEVSLISIATAIHWLDFDKLASKIVQTFPKETVVAVVASPPVQIMNQQLLKQVSWENCENHDSIQDYYEPKLEKYSKLFDAIYYNDLRDYMEFDFESLIKEYFTLPFDNYFRHNKFMKENLLKKKQLA